MPADLFQPRVLRLLRIFMIALVGAGSGLVVRAAADREALERDAARAVESALNARVDNDASAPRARLLSCALSGERLTLDFSGEAAAMSLGSREFEAFMRPLHQAAAEVLRDELAAFEIVTLIDGVPLDRLLERETRLVTARQLAPSTVGDSPRIQPLATRRIAVSPGHGYYYNGTTFVLQRGYWNGIVEDFVNHDFVTYLQAELVAAGADVRPTRNLDRAAGDSESGHPKWQEAARYHVKALGADESVWNEPGYTHLEQDIRCRPRYANSINADILVSLHNNGAGTPGTGTGTETLYDTSNTAAAESKRLADILHGRVISAIRRDYNPSWVDRRVQGFNGSYGENRLATRPSVIIEIAFMDRPTPDNAALQDERFKRLVAAAIKDGIQEYFEGPSAPPAPTALVAAAGFGTVGLAWRDNADTETGFRVERRAGSSGAWETIATTAANVTTHTDTSGVAGVSYTYRVVAFNARGDSLQASNEVSATPAVRDAVLAAWLANVSLRTTLATAQKIIVGLVVSGGSRDVLVRAAGPSLTPLGVTGAMADPRLELFLGATSVAENNDWSPTLASAFNSVGAFPFSDGSRDAALVQPLNGAHTVIVSGTTAGVVLVEAYDAGRGGTGRLVNLSARNRVGTGADILIAGFHVAGAGEKRLLVRAVGPGLAPFGVTGALADPKLEIFDATGNKLAENDTWERPLAATFASVAAFGLPLASSDAALVVSLPAGRGYTAQLSGVNGGTGEAIVEIYELP
jgi:N-acetylmuramoyl-L-alanine amidase